MKKTLIAIAFAAASIPMVFAQSTTPANPPANGNAKTATKGSQTQEERQKGRSENRNRCSQAVTGFPDRSLTVTALPESEPQP